MCDYSLEIYNSRPARKGEEYTLHRFPSGSKGFVSPGDPATAVCIAEDTRLRLSAIPDSAEGLTGRGPVADVTFIRRDHGPYRDGVRFADGLELSLQTLPAGTAATVTETLEDAAASIEAAAAPEPVS